MWQTFLENLSLGAAAVSAADFRPRGLLVLLGLLGFAAGWFLVEVFGGVAAAGWFLAGVLVANAIWHWMPGEGD